MATEGLEMHVLREIFRQKLTLRRSHRQTVTALGVSLVDGREDPRKSGEVHR